ncbi:MAG: hypothetical protein WCX73_02785 [Candidatus Pacearchaeota archaeon]|jgi:hypothetical protein
MSEKYLDANKKPIQEGVYAIRINDTEYQTEISSKNGKWFAERKDCSWELNIEEAKQYKQVKGLSGVLDKDRLFLKPLKPNTKLMIGASPGVEAQRRKEKKH